MFQGTKFRFQRYIIFLYCSFTFLVILAQTFSCGIFLLKICDNTASINRKYKSNIGKLYTVGIGIWFTGT